MGGRFPRQLPDEVVLPEDFVTEHPQVGVLVDEVYGNANCPRGRQQLLQQAHAWIHHAEPFVVAGEVFALLPDDLSQPFSYLRVVYVVVVCPLLFARVVGRVYVNEVHLPFVSWQQGFQCFEVVAMDYKVSAVGLGRALSAFGREAV